VFNRPSSFKKKEKKKVPSKILFGSNIIKTYKILVTKMRDM